MKMKSRETKERSLQESIEQDLDKKMVFLAGPRQSGKTTLAKTLLKTINGAYYNYDFDEDRKKIIRNEFNQDVQLWVFDEIHKYSRWRNWIKGVYDHFLEEKKILITGSAMLDIYHRGGDSLQGRYFYYRFHPLTLGEILYTAKYWASPMQMIRALTECDSATKADEDCFRTLLRLGPFPEPFFSQSERAANRWRISYAQRVVREDIRDLEQVKDLALLELLFDRLPDTVGSPLSLNALREDLEVSHDSIKKWVQIFDQIYLTFRIAPSGPAKIKAVKKEQKLYFWDWGYVSEEGPRFENLVASHLLRFVHYAEDLWGEKLQLRYFKNTANQEVDFILFKKTTPLFCVECKIKNRDISSGLKYLLKRFEVPLAFQLSMSGDQYFVSKEIPNCPIHVMPVWRFLARLP